MCPLKVLSGLCNTCYSLTYPRTCFRLFLPVRKSIGPSVSAPFVKKASLDSLVDPEAANNFDKAETASTTSTLPLPKKEQKAEAAMVGGGGAEDHVSEAESLILRGRQSLRKTKSRDDTALEKAKPAAVVDVVPTPVADPVAKAQDKADGEEDLDQLSLLERVRETITYLSSIPLPNILDSGPAIGVALLQHAGDLRQEDRLPGAGVGRREVGQEVPRGRGGLPEAEVSWRRAGLAVQFERTNE